MMARATVQQLWPRVTYQEPLITVMTAKGAKVSNSIYIACKHYCSPEDGACYLTRVLASCVLHVPFRSFLQHIRGIPGTCHTASHGIAEG